MSLLHFPILVLVLLTSLGVFSQPVIAHKSLQKVLSIHDVDFENFTYPLPKGWIDPGDRIKTFKLVKGERPETRFADGSEKEMGIFLAGKVRYGDVTGDGKEDAILFMSIVTGGSALPGIIYVYTMQNGRPRMLWNLPTGDRADGGFRDARAENGHLVIELSNPAGKRGDCCPVKYNRIVYEWGANHFRPKQKQTFPIQQPN